MVEIAFDMRLNKHIGIDTREAVRKRVMHYEVAKKSRRSFHHVSEGTLRLSIMLQLPEIDGYEELR
jgi:hypothetical protein